MARTDVVFRTDATPALAGHCAAHPGYEVWQDGFDWVVSQADSRYPLPPADDADACRSREDAETLALAYSALNRGDRGLLDEWKQAHPRKPFETPRDGEHVGGYPMIRHR